MMGMRLLRSSRWPPIAVSLCAAICAVSSIAGCNKSNVGTVSGTVTVDGSPAKSGSIAFFPVNKKSPTAGAEIRDGEYLARVPLGTSKVEIRVPKVVGQKKLYN